MTTVTRTGIEQTGISSAALLWKKKAAYDRGNTAKIGFGAETDRFPLILAPA